ncbi:septal ring lytic transglycosylase RlpA family protein [Propionivibrio sp.]|uniref:septal ring lytic transglycosylase RlpA family protein n=1 Tax=Propionivibrio sp. TaxID=2212460 RepID=UPI003BF3E15D
MRSNELCLLPASLFMLLFLVACGGQPQRTVDSTTSRVEPASSTASPVRKLVVTQKRGGGYYKDDGPGEDIPDNLDDIPDAQPRSEPLHRFANKPYNVLGKSYVPDTSLKPFRQSGIASWYGKKFHGQKTSIGEPYDMFSMTAAHPTLAIPSYVRVSSVNSGKSVVVRVTDRGPFHADRIIDLSYAAAYRLGYINNGSTQVEVETILPGAASMLAYTQAKPLAPSVKTPASSAEGDEIETLVAKLAVYDTNLASPTPTASVPAIASQKGVYLQLGAFSNADNAESLRSHLSREMDWLNEGIQINASAGIHRVHLGPYASRADAEKVAEKIRLALGYKPGFVSR